MPMLMPTPEELAHLPKHKRERIRRAVMAILLDVDDIGARAVKYAESDYAFGERVRAHARELEKFAEKAPAHEIRLRRMIALESTR